MKKVEMAFRVIGEHEALSDDEHYADMKDYDNKLFRLLKAAIKARLRSGHLCSAYYAGDGPVDSRGTDGMQEASIKADRAVARLVSFGLENADFADVLRTIADELDPE